MSDWVELEGLSVDCIIGVLEAEQRTLQRVVIDVAMRTGLDRAQGGDLSASIDYAGVYRGVRFLAEHGRFRLLESLGTAVCRMVLAPPPPASAQAAVEEVRVRLAKPDILDGAVPVVQLQRPGEWCDLRTAMFPEKTWLDTLVETPTSGAYRALVEPDSRWEVPPGVALMCVAGRPVAGGRALRPGDRLGRAEVATVHAGGGMPATLLAVGSPVGDTHG